MYHVKVVCAALIALALTTPADSAPRKLRPVCPSGTLTQVEGIWMCLVPPKWVR